MPDIDRFRGQVQGDIRNSQVARAINQVSNQTNRQGFAAAVGVQNNYQPITTAQELARSGSNVLSGGAQSFSQSAGSAASITFRATQSMLRDLTRVRNTLYSPDISQISSRFTPTQTPPSRMGLFESARVASGLFMQAPRGMLRSEYQRGAARSLRERFTSAGREVGLFAAENATLALGLTAGLVSAPVIYPAMGRIREEYNQRDQVRNLLRRTSWRYMKGKNFTEDQLSDISQSFVNVARENQEIATGDVSRLAYTATKMGVFDTVRGPEQAKKEFQKFTDKVIKLSTKLEESVDQAAARLASKNPSLISPDIYGGIARSAGLTTQELNRAGQQGAQAFRGMGFDANFGYDIGVQNLATLRNIQTRNEAGRGLISRMGGLGAANQRTMQAVGQFMQTPQMAMMMGAFANQSGRFDPNRMNQFMQSGGGIRDLMGMFQQNMAQNGGMGWQASLNMNLPQNIEAMGPVAGSTMAVQMLQMAASSNIPQWRSMSTEMRKNVMASIAPRFGMDSQAARVMIEGINPEETLAQMREIRENAMRREQLIRERQGSIKAMAGRAWDRFTGGTANVIRGIGGGAVEVGRDIKWAAENSWAVQYNPYVMMGKKALGVSGELRDYFFGDQYKPKGMGAYDSPTNIESWIENVEEEGLTSADRLRSESASRNRRRARVRGLIKSVDHGVRWSKGLKLPGYPELRPEFTSGNYKEKARDIAEYEIETGQYRVRGVWGGDTIERSKVIRKTAYAAGMALEDPGGEGLESVVSNKEDRKTIRGVMYRAGMRLQERLRRIEDQGLGEEEESKRKRQAYMDMLNAVRRQTKPYTPSEGVKETTLYREAFDVWGAELTDKRMGEMKRELRLKKGNISKYADMNYKELEKEFMGQVKSLDKAVSKRKGVSQSVRNLMGDEEKRKKFMDNYQSIRKLSRLRKEGKEGMSQKDQDEIENLKSRMGLSDKEITDLVAWYDIQGDNTKNLLNTIDNARLSEELTTTWKSRLDDSELRGLENISDLAGEIGGKNTGIVLKRIEGFSKKLRKGESPLEIRKEILKDRKDYQAVSRRLAGKGDEAEAARELIGLALESPVKQMGATGKATGPGAEAINDLRKNTDKMLSTLGNVLTNQTNIAKKLQMEIEKK